MMPRPYSENGLTLVTLASESRAVNTGDQGLRKRYFHSEPHGKGPLSPSSTQGFTKFALMYSRLCQTQCLSLKHTVSPWLISAKENIPRAHTKPVPGYDYTILVWWWAAGYCFQLRPQRRLWSRRHGCEVRQEPLSKHTRLPAPTWVTIPCWVYKLLNPAGKDKAKGTLPCGS
jgi:hypothetical protein